MSSGHLTLGMRVTKVWFKSWGIWQLLGQSRIAWETSSPIIDQTNWKKIEGILSGPGAFRGSLCLRAISISSSKFLEKILVHTFYHLQFNSLQNKIHGKSLGGGKQSFIKTNRNLRHLLVRCTPYIIIILKPKNPISLVPVGSFLMKIASVPIPQLKE